VKTGWSNLAESSKEGRGWKRAILPMTMTIMMVMVVVMIIIIIIKGLRETTKNITQQAASCPFNVNTGAFVCSITVARNRCWV
jgi:heme/copper-type cytochrome/quinol oxidase subunit 2